MLAIIAVLVFICSAFPATNAMSCMPCTLRRFHKDGTVEVIDRAKDCAPLRPGCQVINARPCSCCKVCAGEEGEACSASTPQCRDGLVCYNREQNTMAPRMVWHTRFNGECANIQNLTRRPLEVDIHGDIKLPSPPGRQ